MDLYKNLTLEKAKQILYESGQGLRATIHVRDVLEKKTTYLLGYCLIWTSSILSYVFLHRFRLGMLLIFIAIYVIAILKAATLLMKNLAPTDFKLEGHQGEDFLKREVIDQDFKLLLVGIAQRRDESFKDNQKRNKENASRINNAIQIIVYSSLGALLLLFITTLFIQLMVF